MTSGLINIFKLFLNSIFKQKLVLLLIILAQLVSLFSALFLYGYFYGMYKESSDIGKFFISYDNGATAEFVIPAAYQYAQSDYPIAIIVSLDANDLIRCDIAQSEYPSLGRFPDNFSKEKEVLVNSNLEYRIGERITLLGESYLIVGTTWHDYFIVNSGSVANESQIYSVEINDYTIRRVSEVYKKVEMIEKTFGGKLSYASPISLSSFMKYKPEVGLLVFGVILLSACSTSLGFAFYISESNKTIRSLRASGMSDLYAKSISFLCIFILTLASCIIGCCMYLIFDNTWIRTLSIPIFVLTASDYLIITSILLFLVPVITIAYVCKKHSIRGIAK